MLQYAGDKTDLVRSIRGDEGGGCAAEVMQTHGFPELICCMGADNVVNPTRGERTALKGRPKAVMLGTPHNAWADILQIVLEVGEKLIGHPVALSLLGLGVLGIEEKVHAGSIEHDMPIDGKRGKAPSGIVRVNWLEPPGEDP